MNQSVQEASDLSVIIPTRNRAESLRDTLEALAQQETRGHFTYEVLVIDNGSTDQTRGVVQELCEQFPAPLRYVYEGCVGIPWALNAGFRQAKGTIFVRTDDDILPTPTWLYALWRCFIEEQADGVAGRILPSWTDPKPAWLTDEVVWPFLRTVGCVDRGPCRLSSREKPSCEWVGGNMAFRREVVQQVGGFDTRMRVICDDAEYYYRCVRRGLKVVYEPTALVYHKVGAERMTTKYLRQRRWIIGYYHAYLLPWSPLHLVTIVPIGWYLSTLHGVGAWALSLVTRRPWAVRFLHELYLRKSLSAWLHRLQLWPCGWTVLTGRSDLPQ